MKARIQQEQEDALFAIGLSKEGLGLYEFLLENPSSTLDRITEASGLTRPQARDELVNLERMSLVTVSQLERDPRYRATPPDIGIGALVAKRQSGLQAAMGLADRLSQKKPLTKDADEDELTVELIVGREALLRVISQIHRSAKHEILQFDRPPYLNSYQQHSQMLEDIVDHGVSFRTIVDTEALSHPGRLQNIRDSLAGGEQMRVCSGVPIKAAIIDRRLGLVPLHLKNVSDTGLLLRPSMLLDLLYAHFELLWEQAAPFDAESGAAGTATHNADIGGTEDLVMLLASGLKDKSVAHRLGLSERTFERRVAHMQKQLRATSRFQAGWKAAIRTLQKHSRE